MSTDTERNLSERQKEERIAQAEFDLWTNWFNPKDIADNLEYIPLE